MDPTKKIHVHYLALLLHNR